MPESTNSTVLVTGILALLTGVLGTLAKSWADDKTANKLAATSTGSCCPLPRKRCA